MRRLALLVLVGVLLGSGPRARGEEEGDAQAQRAREEMELLAAVRAAVAKGTRFVAACRRDGGSFDGFGGDGPATPTERLHPFGKTALATLALLHCGRGEDDADVAAGLRYLKRRWREQLGGRGIDAAATYSVALFLMAIHQLGSQAVASGTNPARVTASNPLGLASWARRAVGSMHRWLLRTRAADGLYSYPLATAVLRSRGAAWPVADLSNTQYAMLGLWAGCLCGERVETATLESIAQALVEAQAAKGPYVRRRTDEDARRDGTTGVRDRARGFAYGSLARRTLHPPTGAMTAGGLSSLLVVKALLQGREDDLDPELLRALDRGIWDAVAWLAHHYDVRVNPVEGGSARIPEAVRRAFESRGEGIDLAGWHAYYLWALERALVIAGKRFVGEHDWYLDGARALLDLQEADGSWRMGVKRSAAGVGAGAYPDPLVDTCFALLFLQRASLRPRSSLLAR